jgi:hypothetical protein
VTWLEDAMHGLLDPSRTTRDALAEMTGLSEPMVDWGLRTTLETARKDNLQALAHDAMAVRTEPIEMLALVLAGNVFTAAMRAVVVPLLLGVPVLGKTSSAETLFPTMIRDALRRVDAELGSAFDLVSFHGGDSNRERALIESAEAVAVYGGDDTVRAIRERHRDRRLIAHGHGVSVAFCGPASLRPDRLSETVRALSLDICAYDQRGCLSPQLVVVEETPACSARRFAQMLANEGLDALSQTLPRGPLPLEIGVAQAQWRGLVEVEGDLWIGRDFAVALVPAHAFRWSPCYRNISVVPVRRLEDAMEMLSSFGSNLKCVGADPISLPIVDASLEANRELEAYATKLGTMQTPALDAPADGKPVWHGLFRA